MQSITTKYIGPTNYRGSRIKASCQACSVIIPWDDALGIDENHDKAAIALRAKLGWDKDCYPKMARGGSPDGRGNVYVFVNEEDLI